MACVVVCPVCREQLGISSSQSSTSTHAYVYICKHACGANSKSTLRFTHNVPCHAMCNPCASNIDDSKRFALRYWMVPPDCVAAPHAQLVLRVHSSLHSGVECSHHSICAANQLLHVGFELISRRRYEALSVLRCCHSCCWSTSRASRSR